MKTFINNLKSELILFIVAIIWGTGFIATKVAVDNGMQTYNIMFIRFLISTILLYLMLKFRKIKVDKSSFIAGTILGTVLVLAYLTQTFGLYYTTPAKNSLLTGLSVIFVPYMSYLIFKTKVDKYTFIASILAFIGMYMLSGNFLESVDGFNKGDFYTILCAVLFALHIVITGYYVNKINTVVLAYVQFLVATIESLILAIYYGHLTSISTVGLLSSIYMGVFCTFVAYTLQIIGQKRLSSSTVAVILSLEVVFATILSIFLGYDKFHFIILVGSVLVFLGIITSETKLDFIFKNNKRK
ncbi:DMT family transporter [Streptobacillus felis]|uniref:DMT family transporter n=1 Tax=Streptobacillus felis TaxID=1384509 RepID=A0A7Z0PFK7_9FUSO|nr:DMT family transporter [Streptobacillus felis]NYV27662.1 DMT family transporter [Streptobacillus felis]